MECALATVGALALVLLAGVVIVGVSQPEEPRHIDPDLLIKMPHRVATRETCIPRRLRLSPDERTAGAELLRLAIAWNRVLRSPRIAEWKTALAKIDPPSAGPEGGVPSESAATDPSFFPMAEPHR